jgi:transcriptional regulator with XRE-family HTH domain
MATQPNPCVEFGRRLRDLRHKRGLSQEELANRAGLDRTYISSCEAGRRNVTLRTITRLAEALGVEPETLIRDEAECVAESPGTYSETGPDV